MMVEERVWCERVYIVEFGDIVLLLTLFLVLDLLFCILLDDLLSRTVV